LVPTKCKQLYRTLRHTVVNPKDLLGPHELQTHLSDIIAHCREPQGSPWSPRAASNCIGHISQCREPQGSPWSPRMQGHPHHLFSCALFAQLVHFACTPNPPPCWGHGHRCLASVVKANSPVQVHQMASCGGRTRYSSEARYTIVKCGRALRCSTVLRVRCNGQAMCGTMAKIKDNSNLDSGCGDMQVQVIMCVPARNLHIAACKRRSNSLPSS